MNIYLIENEGTDKNCYHSVVVVAKDKREAKSIHPNTFVKNWDGKANGQWGSKKDAIVTLIGKAENNLDAGVFLASYNVGY